mgnify:CR=1 FL=1
MDRKWVHTRSGKAGVYKVRKPQDEHRGTQNVENYIPG